MRDDFGLGIWEPEITFKRGFDGPRPLPEIPDTGWILPNEYPSLEGHGMIAIDVETCDPDLRSRGPGALRGAYICGVAVGTEAGFRRYYPIAHEMGENLDKERVYSWLRRELRRPVPKVGANIMYDLINLHNEGVEVEGPYYDVQIAEPLLDENRLSYSLEALSQSWLGEGKQENVMREWMLRAFGNEQNIKGNIYRAPPVVVGPYAEGDVDLPLRIFELQRAEIERQGLWKLFMLETRLIPLLLAMWRRGVRVDLDKAQQVFDNLGERQTEMIARIKHDTGIEPDIWAAESIAKIFDAAGVPYPLTEKTRKPSFRKEWLAACEHPVGKMIVEARRLAKFKTTFVGGYILNGNVEGRIHTSFHQLRSDEGGTVSGRFSSSTPNLQNIPIRDEELGPLMRSIFIPEQEQLWVKNDWSQIEYRLAIHHSARLKLRGADQVVAQYHNDPKTDYHRVVAEITGLPRKHAKNINFGILYGMSVATLAGHLGVSIEEANKLYYKYVSKVPFIKRLLNLASEAAARHGVITTLSGRNRHFNMWEKGGEYYPHRVPGAKRAFTHKALNARLQGDAADIMKTAMVNAWGAGLFEDSVLGAPHLTVHDELDMSNPRSPVAEEALRELKHIMETCVQLLVPLKCDSGTGPNWGAVE